MDISKKPLPISSVFVQREKIDTNPDYQRPAVWTTAQKQLLIDTILRGYDIPKLYWRKVVDPSSKYRHEVIDGQQRLRAIWEFMEDKFPLPRHLAEIEGCDVSGKRYTELPDCIHWQFDAYTLDIVIVISDDDREVQEMFLRLQNGTSLKSQEKRNAMAGKMRDFVKQVTKHKFFQSVKFKDYRFTYDQIAAQMCLLEMAGKPCSVKNVELNRMYQSNLDFNSESKVAKKVFRVLDYLSRMYPDKSPDLTRYNVVSLYLLVSSLIDQYVMKDREADIRNWFSAFEEYRAAEEEKPAADQDNEIIVYHERISHSSDGLDSIKSRHEYLTKLLFSAVQDLVPKDPNRGFDAAQRAAIYRRDKGICQLRIKCNGEKCAWDDWHADHIVPWSQGGTTVVANGQVACPACNLAKGCS